MNTFDLITEIEKTINLHNLAAIEAALFRHHTTAAELAQIRDTAIAAEIILFDAKTPNREDEIQDWQDFTAKWRNHRTQQHLSAPHQALAAAIHHADTRLSKHPWPIYLAMAKQLLDTPERTC